MAVAVRPFLHASLLSLPTMAAVATAQTTTPALDAAKMQAQADELLQAGVPEAAVDAVMVVSEDAATIPPR